MRNLYSECLFQEAIIEIHKVPHLSIGVVHEWIPREFSYRLPLVAQQFVIPFYVIPNRSDTSTIE